MPLWSVLGVSLLIFILARIMPGDPARLALGPAATAEQVTELRQQMGLNQPLIVQYATFLQHALRFDFGVSLYTDRPVAADIADTFPATLELILIAGLAMEIVGIGLGIASARFRDGGIDNGSRLFALLCVAMPNFVWALLLMLLASYWLGVLPIAGRLSEGITPPPDITGMMTVDALIAGKFDAFWDALRHLVLPGLALALPGLAQLARLARSSMVDSYAQPYVEFARAYGVNEWLIASKYALRPSLDPSADNTGNAGRGATRQRIPDRVRVHVARHGALRRASNPTQGSQRYHCGDDANLGVFRLIQHVGRRGGGLDRSAYPSPRPRMSATLAQHWRSWRQFRRSTLSLVGLVLVIAIVGAAMLAPWIAPFPNHAGAFTDFLHGNLPPNQTCWLDRHDRPRRIQPHPVRLSHFTDPWLRCAGDCGTARYRGRPCRRI